MKCPHCGAGVPDGALSCPACRTALDVTQKISLGDATWCPSCGALVAPGAQTCPKCGSSLVPEDPVRPTRDLDLPEIGNTGMMDALDSGETGVMTRIESAIPPEGDESSRSALRDRIPRPRSFALAALLANHPVRATFVAALVGLIPNCGASVAITELYLEGVLTTAPMLAGLLASGGVGLLVLWRTNAGVRLNATITVFIYAVAVAVGLLAGALGILF